MTSSRLYLFYINKYHIDRSLIKPKTEGDYWQIKPIGILQIWVTRNAAKQFIGQAQR